MLPKEKLAMNKRSNAKPVQGRPSSARKSSRFGMLQASILFGGLIATAIGVERIATMEATAEAVAMSVTVAPPATMAATLGSSGSSLVGLLPTPSPTPMSLAAVVPTDTPALAPSATTVVQPVQHSASSNQPASTVRARVQTRSSR